MARYRDTSYYDYLEYFALPIQFYLLLLVVMVVLGFTWYINYESAFEDWMDRVKLYLMLTPIFLLLLVHWLSSQEGRRTPLAISLPQEQDSLHRAGGSPWGVAVLLVFLLYIIPYQSKLQESWFPLGRR
ncbi:hypothetical protein NMG60_11017809 [Bertholletia excelsa]